MDFEKLYQTYYMEIYSFVMTILRSSHLAEEITQEVFFKALNTKSAYKGKSKEFTWLCAIAKNTCTDYLRKQSHLEKITPLEDVTSSTCIEEKLEEEQTTLQIHLALHKMDEPYKEVFQLRIFGELSFQKIGQIFGKTETWARVTYHRSRIKLQERMELDYGTNKNTI